MKWILLIIVFSGSMRGGVHSMQVEYNSQAFCENAKNQLMPSILNVDRQNILICTPKGE